MKTGGGAIPARVSKLSVVELSQKKTADSSRRVLAIYVAFFFYLRAIFVPGMRGQISGFREVGKFSTSQILISKIIKCI